jgi:transposase
MAGVWLRRAVDRTDAEQEALQRLLDLCPDARLAFSLTERFTTLLREGQVDVLEAWLEDASASGLPEFTAWRLDSAAINRRSWRPFPCRTAMGKRRVKLPSSSC